MGTFLMVYLLRELPVILNISICKMKCLLIFTVTLCLLCLLPLGATTPTPQGPKIPVKLPDPTCLCYACPCCACGYCCPGGGDDPIFGGVDDLILGGTQDMDGFL